MTQQGLGQCMQSYLTLWVAFSLPRPEEHGEILYGTGLNAIPPSFPSGHRPQSCPTGRCDVGGDFSLRLPKARHQHVEAKPARFFQMVLVRGLVLAKRIAADVDGRANIHSSLCHLPGKFFLFVLPPFKSSSSRGSRPLGLQFFSCPSSFSKSRPRLGNPA